MTDHRDYIQPLGRQWLFPHCDPTVLHAPKSCGYCDDVPDAQNQRIALGIPFSGEDGSPDTLHRPREIIDRWPGNRVVLR